MLAAVALKFLRAPILPTRYDIKDYIEFKTTGHSIESKYFGAHTPGDTSSELIAC